MKRAGIAYTIAAYILVSVVFINAVCWTTGYDAAPVIWLNVTLPSGNGDVGIDSWRLLRGVWFSIYYYPPRGRLTTILDFTLPKIELGLIFAATWAVSVIELSWLAALLRKRAGNNG